MSKYWGDALLVIGIFLLILWLVFGDHTRGRRP